MTSLYSSIQYPIPYTVKCLKLKDIVIIIVIVFVVANWLFLISSTNQLKLSIDLNFHLVSSSPAHQLKIATCQRMVGVWHTLSFLHIFFFVLSLLISFFVIFYLLNIM